MPGLQGTTRALLATMSFPATLTSRPNKSFCKRYNYLANRVCSVQFIWFMVKYATATFRLFCIPNTANYYDISLQLTEAPVPNTDSISSH